MKRGSLWKVSVSTTAEAEDAVSESLGHLFNCPATTHLDFRNGRTTVSVFTEANPRTLLERRGQLKQALAQLRTFGLALGAGRIRVEEIRRENWAESWKRHFKAIEIGAALLVKPSWIKRPARAGQAVVVLDPGLSFGTGQHPTTSFCLRELVRRRKPDAPQAFLDLGTGSGILAIAAVRLGYKPVHALDFDPESVRVARGNARGNRVERQLRITHQDLTKLPLATPKHYDLVAANLISPLLIAERARIVARVRPGGALVVAGILNSEFSRVRAAFESLGLRLVTRKCEQEWASGTFETGQ